MAIIVITVLILCPYFAGQETKGNNFSFVALQLKQLV